MYITANWKNPIFSNKQITQKNIGILNGARCIIIKKRGIKKINIDDRDKIKIKLGDLDYHKNKLM